MSLLVENAILVIVLVVFLAVTWRGRTKKGFTRLTVDLSPQLTEVVAKLSRDLGHAPEHVAASALALYGFALREEDAGRKIMVADQDGVPLKELTLRPRPQKDEDPAEPERPFRLYLVPKPDEET